MTKSEKTFKFIIVTIILAFVSKLLGLLREILIAAKFGAGNESDTFFIALSAVTIFTALLTQSLNTAIVPVLSKAEVVEGKKENKKYINNLLNIILLISLVMFLLLWILAPLIMKIMAYGFDEDQFLLVVRLFRTGLLAIFFSAAAGVFRGYLQSESMFIELAISQIPYNFVFIIYLLLASHIFGIDGLMVVSIIAVGSQLLIILLSIKSLGYKYKCIIDFKNKYIKNTLHLMFPVLFSVAVSDLNKMIDRSLASMLPSGSISALNYGSRINSLVINIFITAISTVFFSMISKEAAKSDYKALKKTMVKGIDSILLITIPVMVLVVIFALPIVKIIFERGSFDETASFMTASALRFYSIGMVGMALKPFLYRVFYSLHDTKTPMIYGLIAIGFNIVFNLILVCFMNHNGLALGTSLAAIISAFLLLYSLRRKIGDVGNIQMLKCGLKSLVASLIMGVIAYLVYEMLESAMGGGILLDLVVLLGSVGIGAFVYMVSIYILKVEEMNWTIDLIKKKMNIKEKE